MLYRRRRWAQAFEHIPLISLPQLMHISSHLMTGNSRMLEASSGNTAIGLAMACAVKGYQLMVTMSESASEERKRILKAYEAELDIAASTVVADYQRAVQTEASYTAQLDSAQEGEKQIDGRGGQGLQRDGFTLLAIDNVKLQHPAGKVAVPVDHLAGERLGNWPE